MRLYALRVMEPLQQCVGLVLLLTLLLPLVAILSVWHVAVWGYVEMRQWWRHRRLLRVLQGKKWWHLG